MPVKKGMLALALLAALALSMAPCAALDADGPAMPGIDVSSYQGSIDFAAVAASGVQTVYIRAGGGSDFTDPYFVRNTQRAAQSGLHYGYYYYVTARDEQSARSQARRFAALIAGTGYDCRPAMDFENFSGLTRAQVNAVGLAFLDELETQTGHTPLLYTDSYAANTVWQGAAGRYPLWAAEYGPDTPHVTSGVWAAWAGFQYADDGRVPGIGGDVDLDRFTGTVLLRQGETRPETRYTVRPGDTLWALSRRFGTTIQAIAQRNGIQNPNLIYAGETLVIPRAAGGIQYTVQPGDTLWALSRRFGTSVSAIAQLNHIANPDLIYVGQVLTIPQ